MPTYDISDELTGRTARVDGPAKPSPGAQRLIFDKMQSPTTKLYQRLVEQVLPEMNRPLRGPEVMRLIQRASVDAEARSTGLRDWIRARGTKPISRVMILQLLLRDQAFQQLVQDQQSAAHPLWSAIPGMVTPQAEGPSATTQPDAPVDDESA